VAADAVVVGGWDCWAEAATAGELVAEVTVVGTGAGWTAVWVGTGGWAGAYAKTAVEGV
jgi:hypothetical protein